MNPSVSKWPAQSTETILRTRKFLDERRIEWMPLWTTDPHMGAEWPKIWKPADIRLPSLRNFVWQIWLTGGVAKPQEDTHVTMAYIDWDGMLQSVETNIAAVWMVAERLHLNMPRYTAEELRQIQNAISKFHGLIYNSKPPAPKIIQLMAENNGDINPFLLRTARALRKMPTLIGDVTVAPYILTQIMAEFHADTCLDKSRLFSASTASPSVGNCVEQHDMTVLEYIQAAYAFRVTSEFMRHYRHIIDVWDVSKLYYALADDILKDVKKDDVWFNERLESGEPLPFKPPDPDAYNVLTKINTPSFERLPENQNKKTFDRVRLYFGIRSQQTCPTRKALIRKYQRDIVKIALMRIMQTAKYKNYGVPIQFYKVTSMTITAQDELEFIFELKTEKGEDE